MMDEWIAVWNTLRKRANSPAEAEAKAVELERGGRAMFSAWGAWAGRDALKYYLHALAFHIPNQIRSCPCDPFDASGSAIEKHNQVVKRAYRYVRH